MEGNGNDLTRRYTARYIPKPTYTSVAEQLSRDTHLVSEGGKEAPEVYVFADPNCIFCHKFWKQARSWMADLGFSGTPGLLFKDTSSQWRGQTGVPDQEALARLLGIAEYWMSFPIYSSLASS